jgi:hypothetical protein
MSRETPRRRPRKTRTVFINGRFISADPRNHTVEAYDLSECDPHNTLIAAVLELRARVEQTPAIAPYLQTLLCETDADGSITHYTPVRSGAVVKAILSARKQHE